jgi:hypothetical protein
MSKHFSKETMALFAAADAAVNRAHELIAERRRIVSNAKGFQNRLDMAQYAVRARLLGANSHTKE